MSNWNPFQHTTNFTIAEGSNSRNNASDITGSRHPTSTPSSRYSVDTVTTWVHNTLLNTPDEFVTNGVSSGTSEFLEKTNRRGGAGTSINGGFELGWEEDLGINGDHGVLEGNEDWQDTEYGGQMAAGLALILLAVITALGNSLVIHAIRTEKRLQTVSNLFLMSLAVADLVIGVIVMPITAVYTLAGEWRWGRSICRFWLATDYTASTASIFNLVVLTLDRYWSVMAPLRYLRRRTRRRATLLIAASWVAASLWLLPVLAWKHINPIYEPTAQNPSECETDFAHSIVFKLVTSALNFYLPSTLIVGLYYRIYKTIQRRASTFPSSSGEHKNIQQTTLASSEMQSESIKQKSKNNFISRPRFSPIGKKNSDICIETQLFESLTIVGPREKQNSASSFQGVTVQVEYMNDRRHHLHHRACYPSDQRSSSGNSNNCVSSNGGCNVGHTSQSSRSFSPSVNPYVIHSHDSNSASTIAKGNSRNSNNAISHGVDNTTCRKPSNLSLIKERKAARQLGVIMGVFLACWVPYFTIFPVIAFCSSCVPSSAHMATISLGYLNSALNPAIYPLCNQHFRRAFLRMFHCQSHSKHVHRPVIALPSTR